MVNICDAVLVDVDVSPLVDFNARCLQPNISRVRDRSNGKDRVRGLDDTAVIAAHNHTVTGLGPLDCLSPGAHDQLDPTIHELVLKHSSHFGVFAWQHLLAAHDQRDLCPKRGEHVHELHTRHTRPNHRHALREGLGRVAIARRKNPIAVGEAPFRNARPRSGRDQRCVEFDGLRAIDADDLEAVWPGKPTGPSQDTHALALQDVGVVVTHLVFDRLDAVGEPADVDLTALTFQTHAIETV